MAAVATPVLGSNDIPTYHQIPETKYELEWADLVTLDLSQFDKPGGFFYITNFGLSQEAVDRQFAIGKEVFNLPMEEKLQFRAELEKGGYNGYKPLGLREVAPGIFDNTEIYNIPKFIPAYERPQPEIINQHRDEIEQFARYIHNNIAGKLLVLCAIVLELPEDYFLNCHRYEEKSDCHLRYTRTSVVNDWGCYIVVARTLRVFFRSADQIC
ncbi:hypothetical protein CI102_9483 [Trichoderma harzianum]|nr:hypothetical protein CI102_9483 [Trichoderma harzianum]